MSVFADSSALVKLYVPEAGHQVVRQATEPFVVSHLARVEVPAALWRKSRSGELAADDAHLLATAFAFDLSGDDDSEARYVVVGVDDGVLSDAVRLLPLHGLRAYDAVQLASALAAQTADKQCDTIAAFDTDLRRAAAAEGLALLPP